MKYAKYMKYFKFIPKFIKLGLAYVEAAKDGVITEDEVIGITRVGLREFGIEVQIKVKPIGD